MSEQSRDKPIHVTLSPSLSETLRLEASLEGFTVEELVKEALATHLIIRNIRRDIQNQLAENSHSNPNFGISVTAYTDDAISQFDIATDPVVHPVLKDERPRY